MVGPLRNDETSSDLQHAGCWREFHSLPVGLERRRPNLVGEDWKLALLGILPQSHSRHRNGWQVTQGRDKRQSSDVQEPPSCSSSVSMRLPRGNREAIAKRKNFTRSDRRLHNAFLK